MPVYEVRLSAVVEVDAGNETDAHYYALDMAPGELFVESVVMIEEDD